MRRRSIVLLIVLATGCGTTPRRAAPRVIHVYFCTDSTCSSAATRAQMKAAEARFRVRTDVWSVRFVPKAEALRTMKKRYPDEVAKLPSNPFPDALVIRPLAGSDRARIAGTVSPGAHGIERVVVARRPICAKH